MYGGIRLTAAGIGECTPNGHLWNVLITGHGILMMFSAFSTFGGFGNYFMPLQIGAPDMAFPRMNNLSFWMYVAGTTLAICSVLSPGGNDQLGSGVGWVLYPPLSVNEGGMSMDLAIFAVHVSGASSILGAINMITTFLNMRAPGMTLFKVPLFAWSIFVTAWLILLALPVLAGAITMLLTDRNFGTTFFDPSGGGDPICTNILWFFGHRSVHHRSARFWYYFARHCYVSANLSLDIYHGLGVNCDWRFGFRRLGSSYVHGRNVVNSTILLYVGNHGDRSPNWC